MITSIAYPKTVDGEHCQAISEAINEGEYYGVKFIKKHKITINEFQTIQSLVVDLWKNAEAKTFQSKVAEIFKQYGFTVKLDEHGVNYHIA
jgi:hypothetical protein